MEVNESDRAKTLQYGTLPHDRSFYVLQSSNLEGVDIQRSLEEVRTTAKDFYEHPGSVEWLRAGAIALRRVRDGSDGD